MRRRFWGGVVVAAAALVAWWLWVAEWLDKPGSYRLLIAYLVAGVVALLWNVRAMIRFRRMAHNVRKDEQLGLAPPGSTVFAVNQRFRYTARTVEATLIVVVSIAGMIALNNEGFRRSPTYIRLVVTYLLGSVTLTAYLTIRDLRVINAVRDATDEEAAILTGPSHEPANDGPDADKAYPDAGTLPADEAQREEHQ